MSLPYPGFVMKYYPRWIKDPEGRDLMVKTREHHEQIAGVPINEDGTPMVEEPQKEFKIPPPPPPTVTVAAPVVLPEVSPISDANVPGVPVSAAAAPAEEELEPLDSLWATPVADKKE